MERVRPLPIKSQVSRERFKMDSENLAPQA